MQGFRILNPNLAPLANPTVDPGFRDDTSIPFFDPILEGLQNKNFTALKLPKYVSYEEQVAKEKAAAAAKKAKQNQGGGGGDGYSGPGNYQIGNTGTFKQMTYSDHHSSGIHDGGNDHGDGGHASEGGSGGGHSGGGYGGDGPDWSHGGKIPPMYAYDGLTKQERDRIAILAQQEAAKPKSTFDFTPSVPSLSQLAENANKIKENYDPEIGGVISKADRVVYNLMNPTASNVLSQATKLGTTALTGSTPAGYMTGLIANDLMKGMSNQQIADKIFADKQLYDAVYDFTDYDASPSQTDFIAEGQSKDYGVNVGTIPNIDMTNFSNYNIKDYVGIPEKPENYGGIFGNYSSPSTSGITEYDPTAINSWEDLNSYISAGLQNDYDYGLTSEDTSYNEKVSQALADELSNPPTSGGSSFSGSSSGGDNDGGMGFDASDAASGADDPMGDGSGSFGANDDDDGGDYDPSFSKGGYVYASQGGYVNSTGGK